MLHVDNNADISGAYFGLIYFFYQKGIYFSLSFHKYQGLLSLMFTSHISSFPQSITDRIEMLHWHKFHMFSSGSGMLQSNKCTGMLQSNMWGIDVLSGPWDSPYGHMDSLKGTIVTSLSSSHHNCYNKSRSFHVVIGRYVR